ncbi:DEBR0S1_15852g1_1 [Brettanomyces bruxellensis]|uniref:DEBR0S1_15852g1_1 n=1 Tax=Dekkera bruxellensis TaxID=5007 RepID=A0A7D9CV72_DEKBR|nr:DEBR0S1_15852g1_1 [Brettanomyces bruxellensis]
MVNSSGQESEESVKGVFKKENKNMNKVKRNSKQRSRTDHHTDKADINQISDEERAEGVRKLQQAGNTEVSHVEEDTSFIEDTYSYMPDSVSSSDGEGLLINRGNITEQELISQNAEDVNHILEGYKGESLIIDDDKVNDKHRLSWEIKEMNKSDVSAEDSIMIAENSSELGDDDRDDEDDEDEWQEEGVKEVEGTNIENENENASIENPKSVCAGRIANLEAPNGSLSKEKKNGEKESEEERSEKKREEKEKEKEKEESVSRSQESEIILVSDDEDDNVQVTQSRNEQTSSPNSTVDEVVIISENSATDESNSEKSATYENYKESSAADENNSVNLSASASNRHDSGKNVVTSGGSSLDDSENSNEEFLDATEGETEPIANSKNPNTANNQALVLVEQHDKDEQLQVTDDSDESTSDVDVELDDIDPNRSVGYDNENCLPDYILKLRSPGR